MSQEMKYDYSKHEQVSSYEFKTHEKRSDEDVTLSQICTNRIHSVGIQVWVT